MMEETATAEPLALINIAEQRLTNQHIGGAALATPGDIVAWMGAVQAQDYLGALWAIGLRMQGATDTVIEQALADRTIVRTWPLRGTLHFVAAADVRWMLSLFAPHALALGAGRFRQLGLDDAVFARSRDALSTALQGGKQMPRPALYETLEAAQISTAGQRGIHILWRHAHDGLICFGARAGKQQTFALLDEWIPQTKTMARSDGLAELARRYFASHGPATLHDFVWWSGLTTSDARIGLDAAKAHLVQDVVEGQTYWSAPSTPGVHAPSPTAYLLPPFDEYLVGYRDRRAVVDPAHMKQVNDGGGILKATIVIDGQVVGTWRRSLSKGSVSITLAPFTALGQAEEQAIALAAQRHAAFLGLPAT